MWMKVCENVFLNILYRSSEEQIAKVTHQVFIVWLRVFVVFIYFNEYLQ